ncbi:acylphosphatase-2-like isoform X3 [Homalodisca vitripennis]|uniref:acylphosphatase-2-like isoform X3 n=1 Tax=Homalodisca vitripennis TaxID=197043 RepID=UPI001EEC359C|nr:acylphosphatase-2-like isoform X3 [Homalodisca vitripennis]
MYKVDVHFKEYTQRVAEEYNLRGYVVYTNNHTVRGYVEGQESYVPYMKKWLTERGSPEARVDKVVFYNERYIDDFRYKVFHSWTEITRKCSKRGCTKKNMFWVQSEVF